MRIKPASAITLFATLLAAIAPPPPLGRAAEINTKADIDPEVVLQKIESGIALLRETQERNGSWPYLGKNEATGLCTLAMLNAGVPAKDRSIQRAIAFIRRKKLLYTYEVALEIMVLSTAFPRIDETQIKKRVDWLVKTQIKTGAYRGMWYYPSKGSKVIGDNSNSQFALLGLYEAERAYKRLGKPSPIPRETWKLALNHWVTTQNKDGSWAYMPRTGAGYGSMTCAGIASIIITSGQLGNSTALFQGSRVTCCGDPKMEEARKAVERGLRWLGSRFSVSSHPGYKKLHHYYYLYALERVGRLTARRFIGEHDWYREGVKFLIEQNRGIGRGWEGTGFGETNVHVVTSYALLFLSKGNRPTLIGKLKFGENNDNDWKKHPNDAASMTRYVEQKWKRDLTWHVIDASRKTLPTAEDFMQAPVIYISGSNAISFMNDPDKRAKIVGRLREYIDHGGFIYAEACCENSKAFHESFIELMSGVFTEQDFKRNGRPYMQPLPPSDPIWYFEEELPRVNGEANTLYHGWLRQIRHGCRTAVVYCVPPHIADPELGIKQDLAAPSCYWELAAGMGRGPNKLPEGVDLRVRTAFSLGMNVLAYATGRILKNKTQIAAAAKAPKNNSTKRFLLDIRQLRHNGNWNAAPGALVKLQRELTAYAGIPTPPDRREIDIDDPKIFDHHMVFMHGRDGFNLTEKQAGQLKKFVEQGGVIFADAVCGSEAFANSFGKAMKQVFKDRALKPILPSHDMFTTKYGGFELKTVQLRKPPKTKIKGRPLKTVETNAPPELEGIQFENGRYGVIFSKYDLSCALEGHPEVKCPGYSRDAAAKIAVNVVLYTLQE